MPKTALEVNIRQGNQGLSIRRGTTAKKDGSTVIVPMYGSGKFATEMHANGRGINKERDEKEMRKGRG